MSRFALVWATVAVCFACGPDGASSGHKAAGTPTDPVDVCERLADVCRLDNTRLGVCVQPAPDKQPAECEGRTACFICQDQH